MKKIGLSGVMGAGKSSVIALLQEKRIPVINCDAINARLLQKGNRGYKLLVRMFGTHILDVQNEIDKQKISDMMFCEPDKKKEIEAILHPCIQNEMMQELQLYANEAIVVIEVPLLFELKWESLFDEVWVVACDEAHIMHRLMEYRGVHEVEIKRRLATQLSQETKIQKADLVIYNNEDKENLKRQLYDILKTYE